jgi:hypothetical protein
MLAGCRGAPDPIAFNNRVFYQYDDPNADISEFEGRYPPLDWHEITPLPEYIGVSLLRGAVRLSRPKGWVLAYASNKPMERFVQYVSPNEYLFSIYERVDSPEDLWRDVMSRYEADTKAAGGEILSARVPFATWDTQGRSYVVKRGIKAAKTPFIGMTREILTRSDHRIVLIQIVHQTGTLKPLAGELYRVLQTLSLDAGTDTPETRTLR